MGARSLAKCLLGLSMAIVVAAPCVAFAASTQDITHRITPFVELGGTASTAEDRAEALLFAPVWQDLFQLGFIEARGKLFEDSIEEGNIALVYRRSIGEGGALTGVWLGYDQRNTSLDTRFHQLSGGLEYLHPDYDFRLNGYLPLNRDERVAETTSYMAVLTQSSIGIDETVVTTRELALIGLDSEVGVRVPIERFLPAGAKPRQTELRAYAGGFYFDHGDLDQAVAGGRMRLELRFEDVLASLPGARLTLESETSWDAVREHQAEAGLRLRIPLGGVETAPGEAAPVMSRMTDTLERDTDIVVRPRTTMTVRHEGAIDPETGRTLDGYAVADATTSLQAVLAAHDENGLIVVDGAAGAITEDITVLEGQTVVGGGTTIRLTGARSGGVAEFTAPGARPTIVSNGGHDVVLIGGNDVHVAGLDIDGDLTAVIGIKVGSAKDNVVIEQNTVERTLDDGIELDDDNTDVVVSGNTITNVLGDGIDLDARNANITITGNTIIDSDENGVDILNDNTGIVITGNRMQNLADNGVELVDNNTGIVIAGNWIAGIAEDVLHMRAGNAVTFEANSISNSVGDDLVDVAGAGNSLAGTGNLSTAAVADRTCDALGSFGGSIEVNGVLLRDDELPCN